MDGLADGWSKGMPWPILGGNIYSVEFFFFGEGLCLSLEGFWKINVENQNQLVCFFMD